MPTYGSAIDHGEAARLCAILRDPGSTPEARKAAGEEIVTGSMGLAWTVLKRLGHHGDDELIQAGRIGLWAAAQSFDPERARWSTFAMMVVRQHINREVRRREKRASEAQSLPEQAGRLIPEPKREPRSALPVEALAALPSEHRRILELCYTGPRRRSFAEVGAILGVSQSVVSRRHRQALQLLREALPGEDRPPHRPRGR